MISPDTKHGTVDGFPTPMTSRRGPELRPGRGTAQHSESEDSSQATSTNIADCLGPLSQILTTIHNYQDRSRPGMLMAGVQSPCKDRRSEVRRPAELVSTVDSGLSTLPEPETGRAGGRRHDMKERSLTSLSLQPRKAVKPRVAARPVDKSPSLQKISPLQHYILEQAKLSGYRYGDKVQAEKRDSYIDSENDSHKTGNYLYNKGPVSF